MDFQFINKFLQIVPTEALIGLIAVVVLIIILSLIGGRRNKKSVKPILVGIMSFTIAVILALTLLYSFSELTQSNNTTNTSLVELSNGLLISIFVYPFIDIFKKSVELELELNNKSEHK